jgi:hypothetical protein
MQKGQTGWWVDLHAWGSFKLYTTEHTKSTWNALSSLVLPIHVMGMAAFDCGQRVLVLLLDLQSELVSRNTYSRHT